MQVAPPPRASGWASVHSLRTRLLLAMLVVLGIAALASGLLFSRLTTREFETFVRSEDRDRLGHVARQVEEAYALDESWDAVGPALDQVLRTTGRPPIVVTAAGRVLAPPSAHLEEMNATTERDGAVRISFVRRGGGRESAGMLVFVGGEPLRAGTDVVGHVFMGPPPDDAEAHGMRFIGSLNRSAVLAVAIAGLAALLLAFAMSRRIVGPVEALTVAVRGMEAGKLDRRVEVHTRDEIGELGRAFNDMAARLGRNEKLRRDMVSDVAHELRTPVTNLRAQIEALQDDLAAPDAAALASLHEEVMHLGGLIDELQELATADAGQLALEPGALAPGEELRRVITGLQPAASAAGIALSLDASDDLPHVRADARRLGQVVRNLVANAIAHSPRGATVTIGVAVDGPGMLRFRVADHGEGIPATHLEHVFERFYRVDPSRARSTGGAGLGLTIVRQLVEAMGGTVRAESREGAGSTFSFTLPVEIRGTPSGGS